MPTFYIAAIAAKGVSNMPETEIEKRISELAREFILLNWVSEETVPQENVIRVDFVNKKRIESVKKETSHE